jgi:hypothetical protein
MNRYQWWAKLFWGFQRQAKSGNATVAVAVAVAVAVMVAVTVVVTVEVAVAGIFSCIFAARSCQCKWAFINDEQDIFVVETTVAVVVTITVAVTVTVTVAVAVQAFFHAFLQPDLANVNEPLSMKSKTFLLLKLEWQL